MLSPVGAVSVMGAALEKPVAAAADTPDTQTVAAAPLAALSNAVSASIEGKLNMLLATVRERMFDSLLAAINAVGDALDVTQEPHESTTDFVQRLAAAISNLPPDELEAVQQQLSASGEVTIPLPLIAEALDNPDGSVAAQIGVSYETNLPPQAPDAVIKAVVNSYGQNAGEPETIAPQIPLPAQALPNGDAAIATLPAPADDTAPEPTVPTPAQAAQSGPLAQAEPEAPTTPPTQISTAPQTAANPESANSNPAPVSANNGDARTAAPTPVPTAQSGSAAQAQPASLPAQSAANTAAPASATATPANANANAASQTQAPTSQPVPAAQTPAAPATTSSVQTTTVAVTPANPAPATPQSNLTTQTTATAQALANPGSAIPNPAPASALPAAIVAVAATLVPAEHPDPVAQAQAAILSELAHSETTAEPESKLPIEIALIRSPVTPPPIPRVIQEIRAEIKQGLEVVIGRAIDVAGPDVLSIIKDNAPLAERVIAQALAANVADEEALQALPRPPDEAVKSNSAAASLSQSAASAQDAAGELSPKLSAAIAAKLATNIQPPPADMPDADGQMRAMMPPLQGIPFVISPYTPVDVGADRGDSLDVDRVDPVDDEEQSEDQGGAMAQDDADEEAPHHEEADRHATAMPTEDDAEANSSKATGPVSELLRLPMAVPVDALRDHAFDFYQRMGAWE